MPDQEKKILADQAIVAKQLAEEKTHQERLSSNYKAYFADASSMALEALEDGLPYATADDVHRLAVNLSQLVLPVLTDSDPNVETMKERVAGLIADCYGVGAEIALRAHNGNPHPIRTWMGTRQDLYVGAQVHATTEYTTYEGLITAIDFQDNSYHVAGSWFTADQLTAR